MRPTDIATPSEWQNIQNLFAMVTGLTSVTFDLDGNPVAPPDFQNEFCRAFKGTPAGAAACRESHQKIVDQVLLTRKPAIGFCKAGLLKIVVPIIYDGEIIGVTGGCGVYQKDTGLDLAKLIEAAAFAGIDADTAKMLASTIKGIDDQTIQEEIEVLNSKLEALIARAKKNQ